MARIIRPAPRPSNVVVFPHTFSRQSLMPILAHIHRVVSLYRHSDVVLDFSQCVQALESAMLPLIPILNRYMAERRVSFEFKPPRNDRLLEIFQRSNWAYFMDPYRHRYAEDITGTHCPAIRYSTPDEQFTAVDRVLNIVLNATSVSRDVLKAIEWSLNEITDNVLNHAGDGVSGYLQATWFRERHLMEFVVADAGMGIPSSLKQKDHCLALEHAVQEGVTRNRETNQGNGLFGSFRIAQVSGGAFSIISENASLVQMPNGDLRIRPSKIPHTGTTVLWNMLTNRSDVLSRALIFKGKAYDPAYDYLERIADQQGGRITVVLKQQFPSLGSRTAGDRVHTYLWNMLRNDQALSLDIDFTGVNIVSSSFADEVFGRLFLELGPMSFMTRIKFLNADAEILGLLDRAIRQRSAVGVTDVTQVDKAEALRGTQTSRQGRQKPS